MARVADGVVNIAVEDLGTISVVDDQILEVDFAAFSCLQYLSICSRCSKWRFKRRIPSPLFPAVGNGGMMTCGHSCFIR